MSDIVERLRGPHTSDLELEAADEIERLTAVLQTIGNEGADLGGAWCQAQAEAAITSGGSPAMIVKAKAVEREAWRYTGQTRIEWPNWVRARVDYAGDDALVLTRKSGKQLIYPGEYLIRDLDGEPEWLTHDMMRREYDEVLPTKRGGSDD